MGFNLWMMVTVVSIAAIGMICLMVYTEHQRRMRQPEPGAQDALEARLQEAIDEALQHRFRDVVARVEVLEAIVTDSQRELNEKLARLSGP